MRNLLKQDKRKVVSVAILIVLVLLLIISPLIAFTVGGPSMPAGGGDGVQNEEEITRWTDALDKTSIPLSGGSMPVLPAAE